MVHPDKNGDRAIYDRWVLDRWLDNAVRRDIRALDRCIDLAGGTILEQYAGRRDATNIEALLNGSEVSASNSLPVGVDGCACDDGGMPKQLNLTGDAETDNISKSGLQGLTLYLAQRTALEAGDPVGLDIARDELSFFPLIYWPVVPNAAKPTPAALARIDAYMKNGGTVLFDTRDALLASPGPGGASRAPGMVALRNILGSLDIPERENHADIMHTLLGIELKVGRHRFACPDLATARYMQVFARIGCREFAIPYDITKISTLADRLETAWQRSLLILESREASPRLKTLLLREIRSQLASIGPGEKMPQFNQSTKQRPN